MASIYYSMSGEGRGHAVRVRAMVERLRAQHQLTLFAPGDAFKFLQPLYAGSEVRVEPLDGLRFEYDPNGGLQYGRTLRAALRYAGRFPGLKARLRERLRQDRPDLVITDFEPALPRAAKSFGIPFVSLNHQHFLLTYDLSSLPRKLRWHASYTRWVVRAYHSGQVQTVVSAFYFPPLRRKVRNVTQVGVFLRPEFEHATASDGDHLVFYCRRFANPQVLAALRSLKLPVRIYGLGDHGRTGTLDFRAIHETRFCEDLASCRALVTTAGNQLVGEALHFGKPVLALPEPRNYEQYINAHFLRESQCGDWVEFDALDGRVLESFLGRLDGYRGRIDRTLMNGVPKALAVIRRCLPGATGRAIGGAQSQPVPL